MEIKISKKKDHPERWLHKVRMIWIGVERNHTVPLLYVSVFILSSIRLHFIDYYFSVLP